ncbi:MAG: UDP-N-acetylglucosamine 1-carboxyvinyltransferase [Proteobacteria bacterium]|nr:UDP-N-acetylglucosamine 1-carboxyvinyltransferase [Pseudomonadota bacterium]
MTKFIIKGGSKLQGKMPIFGAKNACLPLICASVLAEEKVTLTNIPNLRDIELLLDILQDVGCEIDYDKTARRIEVTPNIKETEIGVKANKMRASIWLLAPLLAKKGKIKLPLPGGCGIGGRPVDITLDGFRALGVKFDENEPNHLIATTNGLKGTTFRLHFQSVGATENLLMAASLAEGVTILENVAKEPEVSDTIAMLNSMGAKIDFIADRTIKIQGVKSLNGTTHKVIPDRIITGTYAVIGALCAGKEGVTIENCKPETLSTELEVLQKAGVKMQINEDSIFIPQQDKEFKAVDFETSTYGGFATDLQAPVMMFLTQAKGISRVKENIYENRFMHIEHLNNMHANIEIHQNDDFTANNETSIPKGSDSSKGLRSSAVFKEAVINGGTPLHGEKVTSTDLRASAALVIAGLIAEGETVLDKVEHLDRGYELLDECLNAIGANVSRIS